MFKYKELYEIAKCRNEFLCGSVVIYIEGQTSVCNNKIFFFSWQRTTERGFEIQDYASMKLVSTVCTEYVSRVCMKEGPMRICVESEGKLKP